MDQLIRWHVSASGAALAALVCREVRDAAERAIRARGAFHMVLAGGETPRGVYERLAAQPAEWNRWHLYFGDERCLPLNDPGRNDTMAGSALIAPAGIAPENVLTIPAEQGPEEGARRYNKALEGLGDFDLVLVGLGEDGHTASLFPGNDIGDDERAPDALAVLNAPKPPAERISLSAARLSRSQQVFFVVTGEAKRAAVNAWQSGAPLPASRIRPGNGVDVFLDSTAMP